MSSPFSLALPSAGPSTSSSKRSDSPQKQRKRKRKDKDRLSSSLTNGNGSGGGGRASTTGRGGGGGKDDDSDVEVSDNELVAAEPERGENEDDDEDGEGEGVGTERGKMDAKRIGALVKKRKGETLQLRSELDAEQAKRFDAFSTAVIPKQVVRKINKDLFDQTVPGNLLAVIGGMAKIFVTEVIEIAKEIQAESQHPTGPLQPYHLKLARIRLEQMGMLGSTGSSRVKCSSTGLRPRKSLFKR